MSEKQKKEIFFTKPHWKERQRDSVTFLPQAIITQSPAERSGFKREGQSYAYLNSPGKR